jgi:DNA-binding response OmpR family regulator
MDEYDRRRTRTRDRRSGSRGGRRASDRPGRCPRILIVDYDDNVRRPLVQFLSMFGFDAHEAATGYDGAELIAAAAPELVVADFALPSAELLRQSLQERHSLPLIVTTTGYEMLPPNAANAVLEKPFALDRLLEETRRALRSPA